MSKSFVVIVGFAGNAPERIGIGRAAPAKLSVATTERWKDSAGRSCERTDWHAVFFWNHLAEIALASVHKGSHIMVCGSLRSRHYEDDERMTTVWEVHARELVLLDPHAEDDGVAGAAPSAEYT